MHLQHIDFLWDREKNGDHISLTDIDFIQIRITLHEFINSSYWYRQYKSVDSRRNCQFDRMIGDVDRLTVNRQRKI